MNQDHPQRDEPKFVFPSSRKNQQQQSQLQQLFISRTTPVDSDPRLIVKNHQSPLLHQIQSQNMLINPNTLIKNNLSHKNLKILHPWLNRPIMQILRPKTIRIMDHQSNHHKPKHSPHLTVSRIHPKPC